MAGKSLNEGQAIRYLIDAVDDVLAAEMLLEKKMFSLVIFHSQQASEKASKACLSLLAMVLADEHKYADFLQKMIVPSSGNLRKSFEKLMIRVSILENFYITSRYGVDKHGRIHLKEFEEKEVIDAFNSTHDFVELCFQFLELKLKAKLPRTKRELILYLRENYKEFIR
ncbi:HEPN domain-containing protein [Candidatus Woesearchaeota archaeon]|nr:HEPN domain-containing protein [Candidatus Woesearchaeota archaeon]